MKPLFGSNLLIIHPDKIFYETFIQIAEEAGGTALGVATVEEAKGLLQTHDFDLVISYHTLSDGNVVDFVDWAEDELLNLTTLSLGCPDGLITLYKTKVAAVLNEKDPLAVNVGHLQKHLSVVKDETFKEFIDSETYESAIYLNKRKIAVETVELCEGSVILSFEEDFPTGTIVSLRLTLYEKGKFETIVVLCSYLENVQGEKRFEILTTHMQLWSKFLKLMNKKQRVVQDFLKKASGN